MSSGSKETSRSAPDSPVIGLIENPAASFSSADIAENQASQALKHLILLRLLKELPKLVDLGVVGKKFLPFNWYHSSLCLSQPKKS